MDELTSVIEDCLTRGRRIQLANTEPVQRWVYTSAFHDFEDIKKHGWDQLADEPTLTLRDNNTLSPILHFYGAPKLNDPSWHFVGWKHSRDSGPGGLYPATKAGLRNYYNPTHGIIVSSYFGALDSHAQAKLMNLPEERTVPLFTWKDVVFLTWEKLCANPEQCHNLRIVIQANIVSPTAIAITRHILASGGAPAESQCWPGKRFSMSEHDVGRAGLILLGTDVGAPVGWMLAARKRKLGMRRKVEFIQTWEGLTPDQVSIDGNEITTPCMVFFLSPA